MMKRILVIILCFAFVFIYGNCQAELTSSSAKPDVWIDLYGGLNNIYIGHIGKRILQKGGFTFEQLKEMLKAYDGEKNLVKIYLLRIGEKLDIKDYTADMDALEALFKQHEFREIIFLEPHAATSIPPTVLRSWKKE